MSSLLRNQLPGKYKAVSAVWCSVWYSAVLQMWCWYRPAEVAARRQLCVVVGPRQPGLSHQDHHNEHLIQSQLRGYRQYYVEERRRQEGALLGYWDEGSEWWWLLFQRWKRYLVRSTRVGGTTRSRRRRTAASSARSTMWANTPSWWRWVVATSRGQTQGDNKEQLFTSYIWYVDNVA